MNEENKSVIFCDSMDIENNKVMAVLAYLSILFLVPLLAASKSKFARYHTNQGVILFIASIFLAMLARIIAQFIFLIPVFGFVLYPINFIVCYGLIFAGIVYGIFNAMRGICKPLPLIGELFTIVKYDLPAKYEE
ncbi:MAG: hypothetical protein ACOY3I_01215 [Verrucomicrobiota bacterium]